jgi:hypothetical protein
MKAIPTLPGKPGDAADPDVPCRRRPLFLAFYFYRAPEKKNLNAKSKTIQRSNLAGRWPPAPPGAALKEYSHLEIRC